MNEFEKQDDLDQLVRRLRAAVNGSTVTPDEFMTAIKALVSNFSQRFGALFDLITIQKRTSETKFTAVDNRLKDMLASLKTFEASLKTKKGKVELERDLDDIWAQIKNLFEIMPTQHDNTLTEQSIEALNRKISDFQLLVQKRIEREIKAADVVDFDERVLKLIPKKKGGSGPLMPVPDFGPFHESFAMNGVITTVTLSRGIGAQGTAVMVRYNGQMLDMGNQYTVNGNKITLLFTPDDETTISVTYWGG